MQRKDIGSKNLQANHIYGEIRLEKLFLLTGSIISKILILTTGTNLLGMQLIYNKVNFGQSMMSTQKYIQFFRGLTLRVIKITTKCMGKTFSTLTE